MWILIFGIFFFEVEDCFLAVDAESGFQAVGAERHFLAVSFLTYRFLVRRSFPGRKTERGLLAIEVEGRFLAIFFSKLSFPSMKVIS